MQVGDLVVKKIESKYGDSGIGLIVRQDEGVPHVKVQWAGDYGTFWNRCEDVEVVSNANR